MPPGTGFGGYPTVPPTAAASLQKAGRRRHLKQALIAVAGVIGILVIALGVGGYFYYDRATAPDRSTPGVVVRQYLQATFGDSTHPASDFTCDSPARIVAIQQLVETVRNLEDKYQVDVTVDWGGFATRENGDTATVDVNLSVQVPEANDSVSESRTPWTFSLQRRSGWRVCDAHATQ